MINIPNLSKVLYVILLGSLISCGGSEKQETTVESAEFDAAKEELKKSIEGVVYNIPSPAEIPWLLQATGADFNASFLNDKSHVDSYLSTFDKASLNLGVYAADIGYLSSYEQTQDALDYLQAGKKLADHLGVVGALDAAIISRFESNLDARDSLYTIINSALEDADKYLRDEQRNRVAALVTTGSFIEGLFIATELVRTYPKDLLPEDTRSLILTPVIKIILDQESSLNELIKLVDSVPEDEFLNELNAELGKLQSTYKELNIQEQISNNRADLMLTDETLTSITESVNKIRGNLIL